ncbi:MAG TPA: hypothetical protein VHO06_01305 [Polyangia bacterium]|nr:hypothetical protein [Polyangia bacterium]
MRLAGHQRVVGEARVLQRVLDDERVVTDDAVAAERQIARHADQLEPHARLEPLVVGVDQDDERDLRPAQVGGQAGHVVERFLRRRIDDLARREQRQPASPRPREWELPA